MWRVAIAVTAMGFAVPPAAAAPPSASFTYSPAAPLTNEVVTFTSTTSGPITSQSWDLDGDGRCDDATGPTAARSFAAAGSYAISLCVTGGTGGSTATDNIPVANRAPVAAFTHAPGAPHVGESVALTSFSADPDGPLVSQAWDLDNDGIFDDGQGPSASVSFPAAGDHVVKLLVTDRDGAASLAQRAIEVHAPVVQFLAPFPTVRVAGDVRRRGTLIREIVVRVPDGSRVTISCRGRGCPRRAAARTGGARIARTLRVRRFARRVLRPGAVVRIYVTKTGTIGKYTRVRIRSGKPPSRVDRCLMPGRTRPVRCPV